MGSLLVMVLAVLKGGCDLHVLFRRRRHGVFGVCVCVWLGIACRCSQLTLPLSPSTPRARTDAAQALSSFEFTNGVIARITAGLMRGGRGVVSVGQLATHLLAHDGDICAVADTLTVLTRPRSQCPGGVNNRDAGVTLGRDDRGNVCDLGGGGWATGAACGMRLVLGL